MGDDRAAAEQARRRLVRLGGHGSPSPGATSRQGQPVDNHRSDPGRGAAGWVPQDPTPDAPTGDGPILRRRAMSAALVGYTAAHGHPLEHGEPVPGGRTRWAPSRRQVVVATAALLALLAGLTLRTGPAHPSTTMETGPDTGIDRAAGTDAPPPATSVPPPDASAGAGPTLVVHVVGEVLSPGLLTLPDGARVSDAVAAAGGSLPTADLTAVNLARPLVDGEQLVVPQPGAVTAPAGPPPGGPGEGPAGPVDLNVADLATLDGLPGIGPVLAQRVLDWRTENGRFTSVEELTEVAGIGPRLLDGLRDLVRV